MNRAVRANCFDASALLKLYVPEEGSDILREYWGSESTKFTTSFCLYETLSLLKVCYFYRKTINLETYKNSSLDLCSWFSAVSVNIREMPFLSPEVFFSAQKIAEIYNLDLSDALQLLSVKEGYFSQMSCKSKTILVTADKKLADAARTEGLRVWNLLMEPIPV